MKEFSWKNVTDHVHSSIVVDGFVAVISSTSPLGQCDCWIQLLVYRLQDMIWLNAFERRWRILLKKCDWSCTLLQCGRWFCDKPVFDCCISIRVTFKPGLWFNCHYVRVVFVSSLCVACLNPSGVFAFRYGNKEDACHIGWSFYSFSGAWEVQEFAGMMLFFSCHLGILRFFGLNDRLPCTKFRWTVGLYTSLGFGYI